MINGLSPSLLTPSAGDTSEGRDKRLRDATREFETLLLEMMLKQVRQANRALSGGEKAGIDKETYEGWQDEMFAKNIAAGRGIGLAEALYRQLQQEQIKTASETV